MRTIGHQKGSNTFKTGVTMQWWKQPTQNPDYAQVYGYWVFKR